MIAEAGEAGRDRSGIGAERQLVLAVIHAAAAGWHDDRRLLRNQVRGRRVHGNADRAVAVDREVERGGHAVRPRGHGDLLALGQAAQVVEPVAARGELLSVHAHRDVAHGQSGQGVERVADALKAGGRLDDRVAAGAQLGRGEEQTDAAEDREDQEHAEAPESPGPAR
jgi:hypothetical protein